MVAIPTDGRITSLTQLTTALTGTEVMYIVSPGNAQSGVSFQITTSNLAGFAASFPFTNTTIVTSGATYNVKTTDTRVLVQKTVGSATSIILPAALTLLYPFGVLVKDVKGDAATNNITITFSNSEKCDGLTSLIINQAYGWVEINPIPGQSAWYQTR